MTAGNAEPTQPKIEKNARFYLGIFCFVLAWLTPLLIPLVLKLTISAGAKGTISTLLVFGLPEIISLIAVALLGKETFVYFLSRIKILFRMSVMARPVSRTRYFIGSLMFWVPTLMSILEYRFESVRGIYGDHYDAAFIAWDVVFLLSLFVLGGDFWDKFRSLFIYNARAILPERSETGKGMSS